MSEKIDESETTEAEVESTDQYVVDDTPDIQASRQQERDHAPDAYTTGYDPSGDTRVGIGTASGDVERLVRHNEGRHRTDGNHSAREAARDKKRITQSFCSYLEVTPYQKREVLNAIGKLNLDRFGQQKRLEKVALAVIKVIVERDRFHRLKELDLSKLDNEKLPDRMTEDTNYCKLLDTYEVSRKDLYSVSQLVKRELQKCDHFKSTGDARPAIGLSSDSDSLS